MSPPAFWQDPASIWGPVLSPAAKIYGVGRALDVALGRARRAPVPVVAVGNATVGGTGKTPTVLALLETLRALDKKPAVVTRGYGGKAPGPIAVDPDGHTAAEVGDEALLLARAAPTIKAGDRVAGATLAAARGADVALLDDGFQNTGIAKDVGLLVVDAGAGFGNGRMLPAGPLREPVHAALARTDAVVRIADPGGRAAPGLDAVLQAWGGPVWDARLKIEAASWAGKEVVAFAGIGRPGKFFSSLLAAGVKVAEAHAFPDHHTYAPEEMMTLVDRANARGLALLTTEKDHARLGDDARLMAAAVPVRLMWDDPAAPADLLRGRL